MMSEIALWAIGTVVGTALGIAVSHLAFTWLYRKPRKNKQQPYVFWPTHTGPPCPKCGSPLYNQTWVICTLPNPRRDNKPDLTRPYHCENDHVSVSFEGEGFEPLARVKSNT